MSILLVNSFQSCGKLAPISKACFGGNGMRVQIVITGNVYFHKLLPFMTLILNAISSNSIEPTTVLRCLSIFCHFLLAVEREIENYLKKESWISTVHLYDFIFLNCQDPYSRYIFRDTKWYIMEKPNKDLKK